MTEEQKQTLSNKAKEAYDIESQLSEDMKVAAEAMKRTIRYRKTRVIQPRQYAYRQIF